MNYPSFQSVIVPAPFGGLLPFKLLCAANTTGVSVKQNSPGQVYGYILANSSASIRYVKLYDKASAPIVGTDVPVVTIPVPAGAGANMALALGISFVNGIGIGITAGLADTDATAPAANDVSATILYW